jgi:hypothetical protein
MAEEERKPLAPVVQVDQTKVTKKSAGRQFISSFITDDFGMVKDYLVYDILIPAVKDTIVDTACSAINMIFNGTDGRYPNSRRTLFGSNPNKTPYGTIYRTSDTGIFRQQEKKSYEPNWREHQRSSIDYMDIPFDTRPEAEKVLDAMRDILDQYPSVSVADFYDLVGYNYGNNYTCNDYGWTDLSQVTVTWSRGAWYIALPRAVVIR